MLVCHQESAIIRQSFIKQVNLETKQLPMVRMWHFLVNGHFSCHHKHGLHVKVPVLCACRRQCLACLPVAGQRGAVAGAVRSARLPRRAVLRRRAVAIMAGCWALALLLGTAPGLGWNCLGDLNECSTVFPLYAKVKIGRQFHSLMGSCGNQNEAIFIHLYCSFNYPILLPCNKMNHRYNMPIAKPTLRKTNLGEVKACKYVKFFIYRLLDQGGLNSILLSNGEWFTFKDLV
uniref:Uncharacterized protein n=1 Tax=Eptatretus burgeri TaxID=7764 RepID=A0A8C4Q3D3_EPTBU